MPVHPRADVWPSFSIVSPTQIDKTVSGGTQDKLRAGALESPSQNYQGVGRNLAMIALPRIQIISNMMRWRRRLMLLEAEESGVAAILPEEIAMNAGFDDHAILHH